jgi:ABC-2 type transport system ATP-binding protein
MWKQIAMMRERGTTVILTTHYIEEAEEMADRVGIIRQGEIVMVDDKAAMMKRLGRTEAHITLVERQAGVPGPLAGFPLSLSEDGLTLTYRGGDGAGQGKADVAAITKALAHSGIDYVAIDQHESSLEDIFVDLLENRAARGAAA